MLIQGGQPVALSGHANPGWSTCCIEWTCLSIIQGGQTHELLIFEVGVTLFQTRRRRIEKGIIFSNYELKLF